MMEPSKKHLNMDHGVISALIIWCISWIIVPVLTLPLQVLVVPSLLLAASCLPEVLNYQDLARSAQLQMRRNPSRWDLYYGSPYWSVADQRFIASNGVVLGLMTSGAVMMLSSESWVAIIGELVIVLTFLMYAISIGLILRHDRRAYQGEQGAHHFIDILEDHKAPSLIRAQATEYLGAIQQQQAIEALIRALADDNPEVRAGAVTGLGMQGTVGLESLLPVLQDSDDVVRALAILTLGEIGDHRAAPALIALLTDSDEEIRYVTVAALGQIGDPKAMYPLLECTDDPDSDVRLMAAWALGELGDKQVIPVLQQMAEHDTGVSVEGNRVADVATKAVKGLQKLS